MKYILIFLAGFILLLHNVTPHWHFGNDKNVQSIDAPSAQNNVLEILATCFSLDQGEGHLECFAQANDLDLDSQQLWDVALSFFFSIRFQDIFNENEFSPATPYDTSELAISFEFFPSHSPLRAPPFFA